VSQKNAVPGAAALVSAGDACCQPLHVLLAPDSAFRAADASSGGSIRWSTLRSRRARRCESAAHRLGSLVGAGHPMVRLGRVVPGWLGAELFRWGLPPPSPTTFSASTPSTSPMSPRPRKSQKRILDPGTPTTPFDDLDELLGTTRLGDYVAIQAIWAPTAETDQTLPAYPPEHPVPLQHVRAAVSPPHKIVSQGGPNTGSSSRPSGIWQSLRALGRRVGRVSLEQLAQMRSQGTGRCRSEE
jgi:hypothetical protein